MGEEKISNLEKKKQELEQELERLQTGLDKSIDDVKEGVSTNLEPKNIIRKYPLPAVGAAIVVGFLLGKDKSASQRRTYSDDSSESSPIAREIKRIAAKKGLNLLLDFLEQKISELKKEKETRSD